jgi:long-chain acyl-CoA synthetase
MERHALIESIDTTVKRVNPNFKNYEAIKQAIVVKGGWTVENNMLTPTMKIKRNVVEANYKAKMENWSELSESVIFE